MSGRILPGLAAGLCAFVLTAAAGELGIFTGQADIGRVARPGTAAFDAATGAYTVGGSGENMWFARDEFHFVWTKLTGDAALAADIEILGTGGNAHRKAILMFRQSLETDAAYVDAALHGDGLTSLQFREEKGGPTREIQVNLRAPRRLRLERTGDRIHLLAAMTAGGEFQPTGCSVRVPFSGEFYAGLGVCAHDSQAFERAVFTRVELSPPTGAARLIRSAVETVPVASGDRRCVHASPARIGPPQWTRDGRALLLHYDRTASPLRLALEPGATLTAVKAPEAAWPASNVSPDGQTIAEVVSGGDSAGGSLPWSAIQLRPAAGGAPRILVRVSGAGETLGPPAWSPDGTHLAYVRYLPSDPP